MSADNMMVVWKLDDSQYVVTMEFASNDDWQVPEVDDPRSYGTFSSAEDAFMLATEVTCSQVVEYGTAFVNAYPTGRDSG